MPDTPTGVNMASCYCYLLDTLIFGDRDSAVTSSLTCRPGGQGFVFPTRRIWTAYLSSGVASAKKGKGGADPPKEMMFSLL